MAKRSGRRSRHRPRPTAHLVISYVPLLRGTAGMTVELERAKDVIGPAFDDDAGRVEAVVWVCDDAGKPWPILVLEHADEVFEHLVEWAEGSPANWFRVAWATRGDEYALALMPRVEKSVERYRLARRLATGQEVAENERLDIIFRPVLFRGPLSPLSIDMLSRLPERVRVGFLRRDALPKDVASIDPKVVLFCGPFEIDKENGYLGGILKQER